MALELSPYPCAGDGDASSSEDARGGVTSRRVAAAAAAALSPFGAGSPWRFAQNPDKHSCLYSVQSVCFVALA